MMVLVLSFVTLSGKHYLQWGWSFVTRGSYLLFLRDLQNVPWYDRWCGAFKFTKKLFLTIKVILE